MEDIKNLIEEIPDMDLQDAKYEVWVLGYSADGNITDFEVWPLWEVSSSEAMGLNVRATWEE